MKYQYTIHEQDIAYRGFFKVDRYTLSFDKFTGGQIQHVIRECGKKGDIVSILPYDPKRDEFLLVEQFRVGMMVRGHHPWTLEIVAGFMDVEGESAEMTAQRELFEETGCQSKALYPLCEYYPSLGGSASKNHVFIAVVDASEALEHTGLEEEGEDIRVHRISRTDVYQKLQAGDINNATALIAFQKFFMENWAARLTEKTM